jgi:5-methylcytosine-specific restriction endonuclease McrA
MSEKVSKLKRKADKVLQLKYVPLNPTCFVCNGETSEMHHYIPKSQSNNLRYDPDNLIPLCKKCHSRHHLSGDPSIVSTIVLKKGKEWVAGLQAKKSIIFKLNKTNLDEVLKSLKESSD